MSESEKDLTKGHYRLIFAGFIKGQRINKVSLQAEAFFWRLFVSADDYGNYEGDPTLACAGTAGRRKNMNPKQVARFFAELHEAELVIPYVAKMEPFVHIVGFRKTQPAPRNGVRVRKFPSSPWDVDEYKSGGSGSPVQSRSIQVSPKNSRSPNTHSHSHSNTHSQKKISAEQRKKVPSEDVAEIFDFWKTERNHPRAQLTPEREVKIRDRLCDSTKAEIRLGIQGCGLSDYHMGREEGQPTVYDDIELICRTRSKLEQFIGYKERSEKNGQNPAQHRPRSSQERRSAKLRDRNYEEIGDASLSYDDKREGEA